MRMAKLRVLCWLAALAALAAPASGCVTTQEVERIVKDSDRSIIEAYGSVDAMPILVDIPGLERSAATDDGSVTKRRMETAARMQRMIDSLEAKDPVPVQLVLSLRVRLGYLLTVYGEYESAAWVWDQMGGTVPAGARDRALYQARDALAWWYACAPSDTCRVDAEGDKQITSVTTIAEGLDERSGMRMYLEIMRAEMLLKKANWADTRTPEAKEAVRRDMDGALARLLARYEMPDIRWAKDPKNAKVSELDIPIERFRARVWLREVVAEYRRVARDKKLELKELSSW